MLSSVAPMLGWCAPRSTYACALTDLQCQGRFYLSCDISATPRQGVNSGSMCTHAVPLLVLAVCQVVWFLVDMRKNISDFVEMYHHPFQLCELFWILARCRFYLCGDISATPRHSVNSGSLFCPGRSYLCGDISATPRQRVNCGSMYVHAVMIVPQSVLAVCQEVLWFLVDTRKKINDFVEMHHHPFQLCKLFCQNADSSYVVIYRSHQDKV